MANLGLPEINIVFKELGSSVIERGDSGIVALIVEQATSTTPTITHVYSASDIPLTLDSKATSLVNLCLKGSSKGVKKIVLVQAKTSLEGVNALINVDYNYLVTPYLESVAIDAIISVVSNLRDNGKKIKYVVADKSADKPFVINFTTGGIVSDGVAYSTAEFTCRIAGILASVPLSMSTTYQPLFDVSAVDTYTKSDLDTAIGKGELVIYNDGRKVKIARGVTSLVTTGAEMPESFRKIKIQAIADLMEQDITNAIADYYIGKYPCDYDHKCLLISAINGYLGVLQKDMLLDKGALCEIDLDAQRLYLLSTGVKVETMTNDEILMANTGDKVFLKITAKILDAIESVSIVINI